MANPQNLIGHRWGKDKPAPTSEEATINGKKGGIASGKSRKDMATFKHYLEMALSKTVKDRDGIEHTYKEIGAIKTAEKYARGDQKAQELVLKIMGEMPSEKTEITGADGTPFQPPIIQVLPVAIKKDDE